MNIHDTTTPPLFPEAPVPHDAATHREALHAAFIATGVWRYGYTFERAMQTPPLATCIKTAAEIRVQRHQEHRP